MNKRVAVNQLDGGGDRNNGVEFLRVMGNGLIGGDTNRRPNTLSSGKQWVAYSVSKCRWPAIIKGDRSLAYRDVREVMDALVDAGWSSVTVATSKEK